MLIEQLIVDVDLSWFAAFVEQVLVVLDFALVGLQALKEKFVISGAWSSALAGGEKSL